MLFTRGRTADASRLDDANSLALSLMCYNLQQLQDPSGRQAKRHRPPMDVGAMEVLLPRQDIWQKEKSKGTADHIFRASCHRYLQPGGAPPVLLMSIFNLQHLHFLSCLWGNTWWMPRVQFVERCWANVLCCPPSPVFRITPK